MLTALEREEKFGKVATPCCTHLVANLGKDTQQFRVNYTIWAIKVFDNRIFKWQKGLRKTGQKVLSYG